MLLNRYLISFLLEILNTAPIKVYFILCVLRGAVETLEELIGSDAITGSIKHLGIGCSHG